MNREKLMSLVEKAYEGEAKELLKEYRMVAVFSIDNMPTISIPVIRRGHDQFEQNSNYLLELNRLKKELEALPKEEFFVLGRDPGCDYRWEMDNVLTYFSRNGWSQKQGEDYYMHNCINISRVHCAIKKEQDGTFSLYDRSVSGVCVVFLPRTSAPAEREFSHASEPAPTPAPQKSLRERLKQAFGG